MASSIETKQKVIKCIEELGNVVTVPSVVQHTGLSLSEANLLVNQIGGDVGAHLAVSADGQVTYKFESGFANYYALKGMTKVLYAIAFTTFEAAFFLVRMSFGFMLIFSFLVIVILLIVGIVALLAALRADDAPDISGGSAFDIGSMDLSSIGDAFSWSYTPTHQARLRKKEHKGHFFLECFSFLFGDGDPNYNFDEEKWKTIAQVLATKGGVVSALELAPYTGFTEENEKELFAVLARFDGKPEVTESGNIVYTFEQFKPQAFKPNIDLNSPPPQSMLERYWNFSVYPDFSLIRVFLFAAFNLWGSWWLWRHIATINVLHHFVLIIDILLAYSAFFLIIPLLRIAFIIFANSAIDARNDKKDASVEALEEESAKQILLEAQAMRQLAIESEKSKSDHGQKIVYTTEKPVDEQDDDKWPAVPEQ